VLGMNLKIYENGYPTNRLLTILISSYWHSEVIKEIEPSEGKNLLQEFNILSSKLLNIYPNYEEQRHVIY
jgi:hypothetical protein